MFFLAKSTQRRLLKLAFQPNSVWEGDRLSLNFQDPGGAIEDLEENRDCILWVDGVNGMVRAMDMVPASTGQEAIVRALLQSMEQPLDTPSQISRPARPKKIVVRSRELQFFLRGVLQDLDIIVEYQSELPLIDEFFSGLQRMMTNRVPQVPPEYAEYLDDAAQRLWELAPWKQLSDHQIIRISLPNLEEQPNLYVSVLGKLGMEFGVLFYRSLESLKIFRRAITEANHPQEVFFRQDCFYITFNRPDDLEDDLPSPPVSLDWEDLEVEFGSIHPLEGMQPHLGEEESQTMLLALEGLLRFFEKYQKDFRGNRFPAVSSTFKLSFPDNLPPNLAKVSVQVATEPELAKEVLEFAATAMGELDEEDEDSDLDNLDNLDNLDMATLLQELGFQTHTVTIGDRLIPAGSLIIIGALPWELYEILGQIRPPKRKGDVQHPQGDGLPMVLVQTTRPKAKTMLAQIEARGGLEGILFTKTQSLHSAFELGLLKLGNGELERFGHHDLNDPVHQKTRKNWDQRTTQTQGMCALVITHGVTGQRRGMPPGVRDIVMVLVVPYVNLSASAVFY